MKSHSTILAIVFGFLIINLFIGSDILLYIVLFIIGLSIMSKQFSDFIEKIWFFLALILSKIVPNILLSLIYFLLLTPLAILSKLFNANTDFKSIDNSESNFKSVKKSFSKESFERGW